jgi:hypothetical protein
VVALLLQQLILGLEQLIELLGCEPDRRWENALILHMWGEEKIDASKIAARAKQLADKGNTEDALNLYIKVGSLPGIPIYLTPQVRLWYDVLRRGTGMVVSCSGTGDPTGGRGRDGYCR